MKKLTMIVLAMLLMVSLAACGNDSDMSLEDFIAASQASENTKATTAPTETTTVTETTQPTETTASAVVPQPTIPVTQPTAPVTQPTAPATQPTAPVTQPTAPVTQPTAPVTQPTAPVTQPTAPVTQPTAPVTQPTTPAHRHSYTSKVTKAATCSADGIKTFSCSCGNSYTEKIPATGNHSYTAKVTKAATCSAEGVKTFSCSCGKSYTEKIPATGNHSWGAWNTTKAPTALEKGSAQRKCSTCSATENKALDMLPNYFLNTSVDGRWTPNSISVAAKEVYFENGKLVVHCFIVNGYSTRATNVNILQMYVKDKNGTNIAHAYFNSQNLTLDPLSYVEHTFTFSGDTILSTAVDLSYITINAQFRANH